MQSVRTKREIVRMGSKRTGKAIQFGDLLDERPGCSAPCLLMAGSQIPQMEFDLDLAVQQDSQNPVYYVQYARARNCSIFNTGKRRYFSTFLHDEELGSLTSPAEIELSRHLRLLEKLSRQPSAMIQASIIRYVITLATLFHKFMTPAG